MDPELDRQRSEMEALLGTLQRTAVELTCARTADDRFAAAQQWQTALAQVGALWRRRGWQPPVPSGKLVHPLLILRLVGAMMAGHSLSPGAWDALENAVASALPARLAGRAETR